MSQSTIRAVEIRGFTATVRALSQIDSLPAPSGNEYFRGSRVAPLVLVIPIPALGVRGSVQQLFLYWLRGPFLLEKLLIHCFSKDLHLRTDQLKLALIIHRRAGSVNESRLPIGSLLIERNDQFLRERQEV